MGLQIGTRRKEVNKVLLTLDVTPNAVVKAISEEVDLIISHHPLIFQPLKKITNPLLLDLISHDIGVYCAHTNLDVVKDGVNKALADKLELQNVKFLSQESGAELYQITVYTPSEAIQKIANAVFKCGAGIIGNYENCLNSYPVQGQFKPLAGSNPLLGEKDIVEQVAETKLEFSADSFILDKVIAEIKKNHPYETPVYTVTQQKNKSINYGLGLYGDLSQDISLRDFAASVKSKLQSKYLQLWLAGESQDKLIRKVAVCGGSGGSVLNSCYGKVDVFVTGEMNYHSTLDSRIPVIEAGHFYTENPVLESLAEFLTALEIRHICLTPQEHEINQLMMI